MNSDYSETEKISTTEIHTTVYRKKGRGESIVSAKMNSLAFDNEQVHMHSHVAVAEYEPELLVVKPRHSRSQPSISATVLDEVVQIGGRFTVSF